MIYVESKRKSFKTLAMHYKDSEFIDVTRKGNHPWVMLNPHYPHGGIPIPYFPSDFVSVTVEGLYEGFKIFEFYGIDISPAFNS